MIMPKFSFSSKTFLASCHPDLQRLFNRVVETFDCTIVEGRRSKSRQTRLYNIGKSRVRYPNSRHNKDPSMAVDVAPYLNGKVSWDTRHCLYFAGFVMGTASVFGLHIRYGGDWNQNFEVITDQTFQDLCHFELV